MMYFLRPCKTNEGEVQKSLRRVCGFAGMLLVGLWSGSATVKAQSLQVAEIAEQPTLFLLHSHSQGFLGVEVGDVDQERAQALHLKDGRGAEITVLDHDAPAGKVGLKLHDVILQVDGQPIQSAEEVKQILRETSPGHKMQLVVSRDGVQQKVTVQLADKRKVQEEARERWDTVGVSSNSSNSFISNGADMPSSGGFRSPFGNSLHVGAMVEPLTPQMSDFLGISNGILIKNVARKTAADAAGLRAHDVILAVGGENVATTSDWERLVRTNEGKPVQVEIFRDRTKQLVLLQVSSKGR